MPYIFRPDALYRMPTHFGPSLGPRQGPDGRRYSCEDTPRQRILSASFDADAEQLEALLPPGFDLPLDARVHVDFAEITEIEWLAGRGYNTFGVAVDALYRGSEEEVKGRLLLVLWENMADPIITGREDLGFAKVYCELPPVNVMGSALLARASWDGHEFARFRLDGAETIMPDALPTSDSAGTLHYKYMPQTGAVGASDTACVTFTPAAAPNLKVERALRFGEASVEFMHSTWEQLPTLVHVVNGLATLRLGRCRSAVCVETRGFKDLSDQRVLI